jgi:hypothetical protein
VVVTPAVPDRYVSVQACDQYARWFVMIGNQFTGREAQTHPIVGPDYKGPYPDCTVDGYRNVPRYGDDLLAAPEKGSADAGRRALSVGRALWPHRVTFRPRLFHARGPAPALFLNSLLAMGFWKATEK